MRFRCKYKNQKDDMTVNFWFLEKEIQTAYKLTKKKSYVKVVAV